MPTDVPGNQAIVIAWFRAAVQRDVLFRGGSAESLAEALEGQ